MRVTPAAHSRTARASLPSRHATLGVSASALGDRQCWRTFRYVLTARGLFSTPLAIASRSTLMPRGSTSARLHHLPKVQQPGDRAASSQAPHSRRLENFHHSGERPGCHRLPARRVDHVSVFPTGGGGGCLFSTHDIRWLRAIRTWLLAGECRRLTAGDPPDAVLNASQSSTTSIRKSPCVTPRAQSAPFPC